MSQVASWIRECDAEHFAVFFRRFPQVEVRNARTEPVDLELANALLITGGPDISAGRLRQDGVDLSLIHDAEPARDAWEFAALESALGRGLPVLCICKGLQVLNVALGGTLLLDIPGHNLPGMKLNNVQPVRYAAGARHRFETVNSSHHQAIATLGDGLEAEGWHAGDGIVEQVRIRDYPWGVGVQYHPERDMIYAPLFDDFFINLKNEH